MPLYEYACDACGHRFEKIRKFSDPPLEACPICGGHVHKLQSAPAIKFKGSGFYITDYPKKEPASAESAEGGSANASKEKTDESKAGADKSDKSDKKDKKEKTAKGGTEDKKAPASADSASTSSPAGAAPAPSKTS